MNTTASRNAQSPELSESQRLGRRLRGFRRAAGFTQQSTAFALGSSVSLVQRVEHTGATTLTTLRALAKLYGVSLASLFTGEVA
jgi:transcriptional regulator with XRE-family HTH domain